MPKPAMPTSSAPSWPSLRKKPPRCAAICTGQRTRSTELKNKLAEQHETKSEQPAAETVEPKTAAEIIAARWAEVDGLTATIKGATTAAPVVWLAGDTKPHAKAIEADGGKWSGKKNAYYFRVA